MEERPSVLIVDDDEDFRRVLLRILQPLEVDVSECGDGAEVLAACARRTPDVILLDMRMPRQGGVETCVQVRAAPGLKDVPILILSSTGDTSSKVEALRAGARDYITKPCAAEEVRARILTHLELRRRGLEIERQKAHLDVALEEARSLNRQLLKVNERLLASESQWEGIFTTLRDVHEGFARPLRDILREAGELALDAVPGSRKAQAYHRIQEAASSLEHQVQTLVLAACLEAGEVRLEEQPLDVGTDFLELVRAFRDLHAPLGTGLEVGSLPEPGALVVPTDPQKVRTILWNMLEFACQRTPPGTQVRLDIGPQDSGFVLDVEAGGPPCTDVESTFLFASPHPGDPRGMILPVARSLAELLGGGLCVLPGTEGGLRLRCVLPAAQALERLESDGGDGFSVL